MKKNKYIFVVDLTDCVDAMDVLVAVAKEKVNANVPITKFEYNATVGNAVFNTILGAEIVKEFISGTISKAFDAIEAKKNANKKKNIFVRFWNWIVGKK